MLVTGSLSVDDTGSVTAHAFDHPEKLPPGVVSLLDGMLPTFKFKPVLHDGRPSAVQVKMGVLLAANQVDPAHVAIHVRSARFIESDPPPEEQITIDHRAPLGYPADADDNGITGTVYVALRIGRDGRVVDAQAQQVNLRYIGSDGMARYWRNDLAKPTLAAVRKYTFHIPTRGAHAGDAYFTGILPVVFEIAGEAQPQYGEWNTYVPGPRQEFAWLQSDQPDADESQAVPAGTFAQAGTALRLLTPLGGD